MLKSRKKSARTMMKYFYSSFVVSLIALAIAFYIGGAGAAYICALLCALEINLSFDNAVVNAKVLTADGEQKKNRGISRSIVIELITA